MLNTSHRPYELKISRLTVDKLGVKLYDKASAVVAEVVANSYDADAEKVTVRLPLCTLLAQKKKQRDKSDKEVEVIEDLGYVIEIEDDGHGMTPDEAIDYYLRVGRDRRSDPKVKDGGHSREKKRPVMGRKGIGKLSALEEACISCQRRIRVWHDSSIAKLATSETQRAAISSVPLDLSVPSTNSALILSCSTSACLPFPLTTVASASSRVSTNSSACRCALA